MLSVPTFNLHLPNIDNPILLVVAEEEAKNFYSIKLYDYESINKYWLFWFLHECIVETSSPFNGC